MCLISSFYFYSRKCHRNVECVQSSWQPRYTNVTEMSKNPQNCGKTSIAITTTRYYYVRTWTDTRVHRPFFIYWDIIWYKIRVIILHIFQEQLQTENLFVLIEFVSHLFLLYFNFLFCFVFINFYLPKCGIFRFPAHKYLPTFK